MSEKHFIWDEISEALILVGVQNIQDEQIKRHNAPTKRNEPSKIYCPHLHLVLNFHETLNQSQKIKFRKFYLRNVSLHEADIIILQDVKDLVLFLLVSPVSLQFINFFHLPIVDRFLRALITYFQYYLKVWEELMEEHANTMKKAPNPLACGHRFQYATDLHCLRCILAREYADLIIGCQDSIQYHHMPAGITLSQGEKDLRIFETLIFIAHRVVWIALERKHFNLIEVELHRLFRTEAYNIGERRGGGQIIKNMLQNDVLVLNGPEVRDKKRLLRNSPLILALVYSDCDYRYLILGAETGQHSISDPRLNYLYKAVLIEEEEIAEAGMKIGILGKNRADYDIMLVPRDETEVNEAPTTEEYKFDKRRSTPIDAGLIDLPKVEKIEKLPSLESEFKVTDPFPIKMPASTTSRYNKRREEARKKWIAREIQRHKRNEVDAYSMATTID